MSAESPAANLSPWPLSGEIGGEISAAWMPDLGASWRIEMRAEGLRLHAVRPGVDFSVALSPLVPGAWDWRVERGELDLAELWPVLRAHIGEAASVWSASGRLTLSGEGTWSPDEGPRGTLRVALREGWARSDELDVELSGVELDLETRELSRRALPAGQELRVARITVAGGELEALSFRFGLSAAEVLEVEGGEAGFLGGRVKLRSFRVPLATPAATVAAEVENLQLEQAARLLPWLMQTAQGKLHGRVELSWDLPTGLRVRDGGLEIVKADDAAFRLAPSPGLLTGDLPPRFRFLRWDWARWIGITNSAYGPLREIELGREGLRIESLQVDFWPDGLGKGRTATIRIHGRPASGEFVEVVNLDINFHGPWSEFIAFGLNHELSGFTFRVE